MTRWQRAGEISAVCVVIAVVSELADRVPTKMVMIAAAAAVVVYVWRGFPR